MPSLKEEIRDRLARRQYDEVLSLAGCSHRAVRTVVSLLYDEDELTRWRAVTMLGRLAAAEPDKVGPLVNRLLWTLNDESGGMGWSSVQALGEIGRMAPELLRSAVRVVVHYRAERTLLPGALWSVGRLAEAFPDETREVVPELIELLGDGDSQVRGQAAWSLGEVGDARALPALTGFVGTPGRVRLYLGEEMVETSFGRVAAEAADRIRGGGTIDSALTTEKPVGPPLSLRRGEKKGE